MSVPYIATSEHPSAAPDANVLGSLTRVTVSVAIPRRIQIVGLHLGIVPFRAVRPAAAVYASVPACRPHGLQLRKL